MHYFASIAITSTAPSLAAADDNGLSPEEETVFDEIRTARETDFVHNFWRALPHDPKKLSAFGTVFRR